MRSLPLPEDPTLATWASALNDAGFWATLLDAQWRFSFQTDETRLSRGDTGESSTFPIGAHYFSTEGVRYHAALLSGSPESQREHFRAFGPYVLATTPGSREELRRIVDPDLADLVDELQPQDLPGALPLHRAMKYAGTEVGFSAVLIRIDHGDGRLAGICHVGKPAVGMSQLAAAAATADLVHVERMQGLGSPDRRQTAILMADLEASSPLARRLSTAQYFAFGRRLVRAADRCIIAAGGIVGRHAGDGVVAFFLVETLGSESAAARSCITAVRNLRATLADVSLRSEIPESELSLRFGLHWGGTLYIGRIQTSGRSEVNALGDEMNEAARLEACATGGRALASKALIERLSRLDANALGLDTHRLTYTPLAELATATDKARRDAPSIAVCEV